MLRFITRVARCDSRVLSDIVGAEMLGRFRLRTDLVTGSPASGGDEGIAKWFDIAEHVQSSVFQVVERLEVGSFVFEGPEEAFHGGVVLAASGAAH